MDWLIGIEWSELFMLDVSLLEIFVRGSVIYLSLLFLLRVILKRQAGTVGMTDLLVIVLIADAAQNGMANDYQSLPAGIMLVATLIFWNYTLERLSYHYSWFERLISHPPLVLVKNGRMIRKNMRQEWITKDDLMSHLREQGIEKISQVKNACLEGDGKISVIKMPDSQDDEHRRHAKEIPV